MFFNNPCEHNGYVITGNVFELAPGRCQSQLLVERDGFEQQALLAGRRMVEGAGFTLRTAAESA
jgi:hypothetical protein